MQQLNCFTGTIEKIKFNGMGNTQTVTLSGRDYSAKLQDITIEPIVYSNSEISTIVTNILSQQEIIDITTTNVDVTTTTLQRMSFNQQSIFDAYSELAELAGFIFYVDENKDLHFEKKEFVSSGQEFNNTNITSSTFNNTREGMANRIWVYGDRYLSGFTENLSTTGSETYTLLSKPHNTSISYQANTLKGSVEDITITPTSGTDYTVNFFDKQIRKINRAIYKGLSKKPDRVCKDLFIIHHSLTHFSVLEPVINQPWLLCPWH